MRNMSLHYSKQGVFLPFYERAYAGLATVDIISIPINVWLSTERQLLIAGRDLVLGRKMNVRDFMDVCSDLAL